MGAPGERRYAKGTVIIKAKLMNGKQTKLRFEIEPRDPPWSNSMLISKEFLRAQAKWIQESILSTASPSIKLRYFRMIATLQLIYQSASLQGLPDVIYRLIGDFLIDNEAFEKICLLDVDAFLSDITSIYSKNPVYYAAELEVMNSFTEEDKKSMREMVANMVKAKLYNPIEPSVVQQLSDGFGINSAGAFIKNSAPIQMIKQSFDRTSIAKSIYSTSFFAPKPEVTFHQAPIAQRLFAFNNFLQKHDFAVNGDAITKDTKNYADKTAEQLALEDNDSLVLKTLGVKNTTSNRCKNITGLCSRKSKIKPD